MSVILESLSATPPQITLAEASHIANTYFNIRGNIKFLGGERDQNFLIENDDGTVTLKVANPVESDSILEMQCGALRHISLYRPDTKTPTVIPTVDNKDWAVFTLESGETLRARMFTFLPGIPIPQGATDSSLLFNLGKTVAEVNIGLRGYMHPVGQHPLAWNTQSFDQLSSLIKYIDNAEERLLITKTLTRFNKYVKPRLANCRSQIIHNDICFHNTAINPDNQVEINGVFDFGDMVYGPLIQDLSNPAAEVPAGSADPLSGSAKIIAGFHSLTPLEDEEISLLVDLIPARLCTSLLIAAWSAVETTWTDNRDHLDGWHTRCVDMLKILYGEAEYSFENIIRSTCGLPSKKIALSNQEIDRGQSWRNRQRYIGNANYFAYDQPVHADKGEGVWLYDTNGTRFLDAYNNVPHAGHCHPRITAAINKQTALLNTNTRYVYDIANDYAKRITDTLPDELDTCYFVSSGSEANDLAWRLAANWSGNRGALVLDNAYHGITEITYALSPAEAKTNNGQFPWVETFPAPDDFRGRWKRNEPNRGQYFADLVNASISNLEKREIAPAALFLDMIMSSNGIFTPPWGYLETLFDHVRNAGGLCVADEVQSGFGRTGKHMWGFQFGDVVPDIVTFGKPIAGGYPMGLVVTRKEIAQSFEQQGDFFSTTGGNPVACAAALAMLDVIESEQLMENAATMGDTLMTGIKALASHYPVIGDIRGSGLFIGVELIKDKTTLEPATKEAETFVNTLRDNGVLIGRDGVHGNVLKIRPPMVIDTHHVQIFLNAFEKSLNCI